MNSTLRSAYRFFRKHAGGIVGQSALNALQLAKAEIWAESNGYRAYWEYDTDGSDCLGDHAYWCADYRRFKAGRDRDGGELSPGLYLTS